MADSSSSILFRAMAAGAAIVLGGVFAQVAVAEAPRADPGSATIVAKGKRQPPITGRLSRSGYKIIALSTKGRAASVRVKGKRFSVRPPASTVTLHLRAPNGRYAGPVVVRRAGKRVVLGVSSGAQLATIRIRDGYAVPTRKVPRRWTDSGIVARAKKGVPIGAGRVGLVLTALPRKGGPGDRDLDGIPNALDVDDDGDLILDGYDRPTAARSAAQPARLASFPDGTNLQLTTMIGWTPYGPVNVNGGSTDEQLAAVERNGGLLGILWGGLDPGTGELDCGTLSYCTRGGTGLWRETNEPPDPNDPRVGRPSFPECCDADDDGLGSLIPWAPSPNGPKSGQMFLLPGATVDEMHADDVLIARGTEDGTPVEYPSSVGFVFASNPVIVAYDDLQGHAGRITYPPAPQCREQSGGAPGGPACNPEVTVNSHGELVLRLTIARPQRPRLASEPGTGKWMDVGHLAYLIDLQMPGGQKYCPTSAYEEIDPSLEESDLQVQQGQPVGTLLVDRADDRPSAIDNTLSVTLNLTKCYQAYGATTSAGTEIHLWAYALSSTYPGGAPPAWAQSRRAFMVMP